METRRLQRLREVAVPHMSRRSDNETQAGQKRRASPPASEHKHQAARLKAVTDDKAPPIDWASVFGPMMLQELSKAISSVTSRLRRVISHACKLARRGRTRVAGQSPETVTQKGVSPDRLTARIGGSVAAHQARVRLYEELASRMPPRPTTLVSS
jgi:hypothetical protein